MDPSTTPLFDRIPRGVPRSSQLPPELLGNWKQANIVMEIRGDDRLYLVELDTPYLMTDGGQKFESSGTIFIRMTGDPASLVGLWHLEGDPAEQWYFRSDGRYSYQFPGAIYDGYYTYDSAKFSTWEARSGVFESGGVLTFSSQYSMPQSGPWSLAEPTLTINIPGNPQVWTRLP